MCCVMKFGQDLLQEDQIYPTIKRTGQKVRFHEVVSKNADPNFGNLQLRHFRLRIPVRFRIVCAPLKHPEIVLIRIVRRTDVVDPQCTTSREDRQIMRMAAIDRLSTSRTVADHIESVTHHSMSARTIRRRLQQSDLSARRPLLGLP
ncbi:HTH_Tnp_Tc3_2 domain-containing protein [Trichonephila clavipes]|nr:HTH_Tnp_Tc3_2 domain-containing protein [Trichonephila clavipes]